MPPNMPSEEEIRRRVEKRIKQRNEFYIHLAVYIAVNLLLWGIWFFTSNFHNGEDNFPWPFIPMMGWGIGIVAHGLTVYFNSARRIEARERAVQREIERERERLANDDHYEKPKRDQRMRLTEDGELIEIADDDAEEIEKRKRDR
jgi:2TM domain-containing protein